MTRPATQSDVPELASLFASSRASAMPWLPVLHTHSEDLRFFSKRILPNQTVEVIDLSGRLGGFVSYYDDWIEQLYIHPDHWRQGYGSVLLTSAMAEADFRQLWVFERNRAAQAFYSRHGFTVIERTDGSGNEEKCADLRMVWSADNTRLP